MTYAPTLGVKSQKARTSRYIQLMNAASLLKPSLWSLDVASYEHMTGEHVDLTGNQVILLPITKGS